MNANRSTRIRFEDDSTILSDGEAPDVVLNVGASAIAMRLFRHDPPTPGAIERAIDEVEDGLAATGLKQAMRGDLQVDNPVLFELLGMRLSGERMTREQVEARFQRLASMSLGYPPAKGDPPSDPLAAALLLILRECMHHLGYECLVDGASDR